MPDDDEPILDVARGDRAISQHLRHSLSLLRERSDNEDFRRLADDILAGRAHLRDVFSSPAFAAGLNPFVERFAERYEQLSDAERAEMAASGRAELEAERARLAGR
ncbi:hypothetical protein F4553_004149 [Allocatelliglobosispora scoriae]|uniref:Uncharacterized protein n=1 Tax=Allocatelliglobosispora scoriae TaxID=643052 RepID=A0A841BVH5_9ACTN|nr:hypothetical protein [Allocatelliglobosispora scoriae]MBB5870770.1 hypothetical protein [Allocatelliglobosispora scoriae]